MGRFHFILAIALFVSAPAHAADARNVSPLSLRWSQQVEPVRSVALSPEGERLLWLDWQGQVRCLDERGRQVWSRRVPNVSRLVAGPEARLTAAFWLDSPLHPEVVLLGPKGEEIRRVRVDGAIASVAVSGDGRRVAVGARTGSLYVLDLDGDQLHQRQVRVDAAVVELFFARSRILYFVTAAPAGLGRLAADGALEWHSRGRPETEYLVSPTPEGRWIAVVERTPSQRTSGRLSLWNGRGQPVWSRDLGGWPTMVRAAHGAARILVGLERRSTGGPAPRSDRSLVCFGAEGKPVWSKGGTFRENPLFVTMDAGGEWVVLLGGQFRFWLLGDQGEYRWRQSTKTPVQIAVGSADGSSVGVAFAGGRLAWLHIPRPPND